VLSEVDLNKTISEIKAGFSKSFWIVLMDLIGIRAKRRPVFSENECIYFGLEIIQARHGSLQMKGR